MLGLQGVEKSERMIHEGRPVGELAFFFGMRHLGEDMPCQTLPSSRTSLGLGSSCYDNPFVKRESDIH